MKVLKNIYTWLAVSVTAALGLGVTSCNDNIPADSYYTFTGEMMSDYIQSRPDFSKFAEIVNRSRYSQRGVNIMDLISCYGQYTCFAPTNEAVDKYLAENNYASVADIPADICDTLARTHLVSGRIFNTSDLQGLSSLSSINMNERYLQVSEGYAYMQDDETIYTIDSLEIADKDDVHNTYRLNRSGYVIQALANDSVENGIVHPVTAVLSSSNATVVDLVAENDNLSLLSEAMQLTGLSEYIKGRIKDSSWDPEQWEDVSVFSGAQTDYCHVPQQKKYGFTIFACPNNVLKEKYNITDLQSFYNYAQNIYGGESIDVNSESGREVLYKDKKNPLRRLLAYNILNTKGMYDNLTTICTIETSLVNPTEWYSTMDSLTTIKIESLTVSRFIGKGPNDKRNDLYLNRGDMSRGDFTPGIHVEREVDGELENEGINGVYYLTDGLADWGEETKQNIFNTRMRMDMYTMFPEMHSNTIRDGRTNNFIAQSNNPDINVTSPNYWFPKGYLDNVKINDDGIFLFQSQHNTYWSYEGDEFNLASNSGSYDLTFNLPSVPTGTYQIRLGFADMPTRGICQFYLDGEPKGIPFDMRDDNFVARSGFFELTTNTTLSAEQKEADKKNMHNKGWYHGPRSVFNFSTEGTKDGANAAKNLFCNNSHTIRYVLCTTELDENVQHTVRIKSVWAPSGAVGMFDYFEIVPKSVYGVDGTGKAEDDL